MTAPASAAPGAGDAARPDPPPVVEQDAHAARLRGVPSGVHEERAHLVRFVANERRHLCWTKHPQAIRRPIGSGIPRGEWTHRVVWWAKAATNAAHEQVRARERRRGERHEPDEDDDRGDDDGDRRELRDDQQEEHDPVDADDATPHPFDCVAHAIGRPAARASWPTYLRELKTGDMSSD